MIANSYAKALYELQIPMSDIDETQRILDENPLLLRALSSPAVQRDEKHRVADDIFPSSMRGFIKVVCDNGRCGQIGEIFEEYRNYFRMKNKILRAALRYVTPPDERQTEGIKSMLKKKYGMNSVELEMKEDKSLIGGFVLNACGVEYDRSVKTRLKYIKGRLTGR